MVMKMTVELFTGDKFDDIYRRTPIGTASRETLAKLIKKSHLDFPYGFYIETDGSRVVFNRNHQPIARQRPSGEVEIVKPGTWIKYVSKSWIYDDGAHAPSLRPRTHAKILDVVDQLGIGGEIVRRFRAYEESEWEELRNRGWRRGKYRWRY